MKNPVTLKFYEFWWKPQKDKDVFWFRRIMKSHKTGNSSLAVSLGLGCSVQDSTVRFGPDSCLRPGSKVSDWFVTEAVNPKDSFSFKIIFFAVKSPGYLIYSSLLKHKRYMWASSDFNPKICTSLSVSFVISLVHIFSIWLTSENNILEMASKPLEDRDTR